MMFKIKVFGIGMGCIAFGIFGLCNGAPPEFLFLILFGALCCGGVIWSIVYKINRDRKIIERARAQREASSTTLVTMPLTAHEATSLFLSEDRLLQVDSTELMQFLATHTRLGHHPETGDIAWVSNTNRFAGTYIAGVQGSGKSNLMLNMILHDVEAYQ